MHLVSWNVAGWKTTHDRIKANHQTLQNWLIQHHIDILCIQEVKISQKDLTDSPNAYGAQNMTSSPFTTGSQIDLYDTFWACPRPSATTEKGQGSGLNGVATFVKKGMTVSACPEPLQDPMLDCEGRCLLTEHDSFVVFNVYIPNRGDGYERYPFKMKFHRALEAAVTRQKRLGKRVIVAGDFNATMRPSDVCRPHRRINIKNVLTFRVPTAAGYWTDASVSNNNTSQSSSPMLEHVLPNEVAISNYPVLYSHTRACCFSATELTELAAAVYALRAQWPEIEHALPSVKINVIEKEGKTVYRVNAVRHFDNKLVKIGKDSSYKPSLSAYSIEGLSVTDKDTKEDFVVKDPWYMYHMDLQDVVRALGIITVRTESEEATETLQAKENYGPLGNQIGNMSEESYSASVESNDSEYDKSNYWAQFAIAGVNEEQLKLVARPLTDRQWDLIADAFGEACHPRGSVDWLNSFITRQDLVDTFSESWPDVRGRFTCWDQYTNSRYVNEGSRIDMVLVDREWWLAQGERGEALSGAEMSELFSAGDDECASSVGKRKRNIASVDSLTYKSTVMMDQQLMNALRVCTANGLFRKAAYSGDGIPTATKEAYNHQFRAPHTGIVYTPPEYSDHVGVSAVFRSRDSETAITTDDKNSMHVERTETKSNYVTSGRQHLPLPLTSLQLSDDVGTRKCQPHRRNKAIFTHFKPKTDKTNLAPITHLARVPSTASTPKHCGEFSSTDDLLEATIATSLNKSASSSSIEHDNDIIVQIPIRRYDNSACAHLQITDVTNTLRVQTPVENQTTTSYGNDNTSENHISLVIDLTIDTTEKLPLSVVQNKIVNNETIEVDDDYSTELLVQPENTNLETARRRGRDKHKIIKSAKIYPLSTKNNVKEITSFFTSKKL